MNTTSSPAASNGDRCARRKAKAIRNYRREMLKQTLSVISLLLIIPVVLCICSILRWYFDR